MQSVTTAEQFADDLAARKVIMRRIKDEETRSDLIDMLDLDMGEIGKRYTVGANLSERAIGFVDGSIAVVANGRWWPALFKQVGQG